MKYVLAGLLICLFAFSSYGQYTLIDKARMAKSKGLYEAAFNILDNAEERAKPAEMASLWFERGSILEIQYWKGQKSFEHLYKLLGCYKYAFLNSQDAIEKIAYQEKIDQWWELLVNEGKKAYILGNYPIAEEYFEACRELLPERMEPYYYSGLCYFDQEEWEKSKIMIQLAFNGDFHQTEGYRAMIYISRMIEHDTRKAVDFARKGLIHLPNDSYLREEMAIMLIHLGDFVMARPHLLWLISQNPENSEYLFNLARSYEISKELYTAEWFYKNLLENEPQNFEAWYNLGVLNFNQASRELQQSEPQEGYAHLTKAMYAFEEASKLQPQNPEVMQNLYQIYQSMGLVEKAKFVKGKFPQSSMAEQIGIKRDK